MTSDQPMAINKISILDSDLTSGPGWSKPHHDPTQRTCKTQRTTLEQYYNYKCVRGRLQSDHGTDSGRKAAAPKPDVRLFGYQPGG